MKKNNPVIEIVIAGDEILTDPVRDKNAQFFADSLRTAGFDIGFISMTGDSSSSLSDVFKHASERADIVLSTGGLGPTSDDNTIAAFAGAFGLKLVLDQPTMKHIEALFKRRKRSMSDSNIKQAMIPEGAAAFENKFGTAPGVYARTADTDFYFMPGVPAEMERLFAEQILPKICGDYEAVPREVRTLRLTGITESALYDKIASIRGAKESVRYYPSLEGITVKIVTDADAEISSAEIAADIADTVGDIIFASSGESLEEVVGNILRERGLTVGIAESCTGGRVTNRLIKIPGASYYVMVGVVAYSNEAKREILGVPEEIIRAYGAVSAEVADAMAEGVRRISGADIGISTTGIAGPDGGSAEKPVGLMYTGIATARGTETKKLQFFEDRLINMGIMSQAVLNSLRYHLIKKEVGS